MNQRLSKLKDRHLDARCVIVANGPSLNETDTSFLKHEFCIGLNKIYLGFEKFGFYPHYYVAVNQKVVRQAAAEIQSLSSIKLIGKAAADPIGMCDDALTHVVQTHAYNLDDTGTPVPGFCKNIAEEGVHEGWTVTHVALQLAYFLGFKEVYLIGLDHRFSFDGAPNEAQTMLGPDPNHFSGGYFGGGQDWDTPDLYHSEQSYKLARRVFEEDGRRIFDATVDGACHTFEKVDYRKVFC